jgi:hypothetical protein
VPPLPTLFGSSRALLVLVGLLVLAVGFHLGLKLARHVLRRRVGRTRKIGRRGEERALAFLDYEGYRILDREVVATGRLQVDGHAREYVVRADALVRRHGRTYVAELKGGAEVSRVTHRGTRRQLLEYATVFDVDGVLLVDGKRRQIHRITFPPRPGSRRP